MTQTAKGAAKSTVKHFEKLQVTTPSDREIAMTRVFDDPWYEGEAVDTMTFVERNGKTTATATVLYASTAVRDAVLKSPMDKGVAEGYGKLDEVLLSLSNRK
jgi:hypothetical protein